MLQLQRASAGSGKTYTLAKKFIWFLLSVKETGRPRRLRTSREINEGLPRILAITFTNKATNEMKQRIVEKLADLAVAADPAKVTPLLLEKTAYLREFAEELGVAPEAVGKAAEEALAVLLNEYSDFRVSTIDSFFQSVLRTFAYESNLNDSYQVEIDSDYLALAAIDATLDEINRPSSEDSPSRRWLKILMEEASQSGNSWNIFQKSGKTDSIYSRLRTTLSRIESEEFKEIRNALDKYFIDRPEGQDLETIYLSLKKRMESPLKEAIENARKLARQLEAQLKAAGIDPAESCTKNFPGHLAKLRKIPYDYAGTESKYIFKAPDLTGKSIFKKGVSFPQAPALTALAAEMYEEYNRWLELRQSPEWVHWKVYARNLPYLGLLGEARLKINEFLDTNNLIQLGETNSMLQRIIGEDDTPFIYERLGSTINHYLIDEFQDTSRMQWDNLRPLLKESDSRGQDNLIIGDAKQSIYRFRNAEPSLITTTVPALFPGHHAAGMNRQENTNWRSERRIVEFNNQFFSAIAEDMEAMKLGELSFADLYSNVAQYSSHRKEKGYVEVRFIKAELSEEEKEAGRTAAEADEALAAESVGPLITSLLRRGAEQRDIALLVDRNDQGKALIAALVAYNAGLPENERKINFISEESLLVSQSPAVAIIVNVLRTLMEGFGKLRWGIGKDEVEPVEKPSGFLRDEASEEAITEMVSDMQTTALPALVEAITEKFVPEDMRIAQAVFIAAFQDMVLDYTDRYACDIASFLSWWDSKGVSRSISSPEGTDAVQIMTVHKSKGLEFKCVIIPFATSTFEPTKKSEWRWVKPAPIFEGCGLPPFLPVETKKDLLETVHAPQYVEYHDHYMMDKINSAYVAFTRAVEELYIFTRDSKTKSNLGYLLREKFTPDEDNLFPLSPADPELLLPESEVEWDEDKTLLTVGSKSSFLGKEKKKEVEAGKSAVEERILDEYGVDSSPAILHIIDENAKDSSTLEPVSADDDPRSEGNLLHAVMERVEQPEDLHEAILTLRMRGVITRAQALEWEPMLEEALSRSEVAGWFDRKWRVVNEREIIVPKHKNRRPDRVMFNADRSHAVVIDYKFGAVPDGGEHIKQVRDYMSLLHETVHPHKIEGYVWYVRENKIVKV